MVTGPGNAGQRFCGASPPASWRAGRRTATPTCLRSSAVIAVMIRAWITVRSPPGFSWSAGHTPSRWALHHTSSQLDGAAEEVKTHHRGFAALPGDDHLGRAGMRLDQLAQVQLQQVIGHPEPAARIEHLLGQEETVGAVQVADRPGRLGQQMECQRGARWKQRAGGTLINDAHLGTSP